LILNEILLQVYPDPVRVIAFGVPVEELEKNPDGEAGVINSVEFCGGTHLLRSGHMVDFVITSEEAIAKGIRRIVALTGPEAEKSRKKTALLETELKNLQSTIEADKAGTQSKEYLRKIQELSEDVSQAVIPYVKKDEMRNTLKLMKKDLDDKDRASKAAVSTIVVDQTKQLCQENPDAKFFVHRFEAFNNTKALDSALKQVKVMNPNTSALFVTVDQDSKKIFLMANASKTGIDRGLKANEWIQQLSSVIGGKGGGKPESAQASGSNYDKVDEVLELAKKFASSKLE
jgi:alanyl-tRNA synthetase